MEHSPGKPGAGDFTKTVCPSEAVTWHPFGSYLKSHPQSRRTECREARDKQCSAEEMNRRHLKLPVRGLMVTSF